MEIATLNQKIVDMFLAIDYSWKSILLEQLSNCNYVAETYDNAYFINFTIPNSCRSIRNTSRVPLSIIIEFDYSDNSTEIHYGNNSIPFNSVHSSPIECNMHIVNGYLKEIEVFTLAGTHLYLEGIFDGKKHYLIRS